MIDGAAIFDFDGTLTVRDTLPLWLVALRGRHRVALALAEAGIRGGFTLRDRRTAVKRRLLHRLTNGVPLDEARGAAERAAERVEWRPEIVAAFREHRAAGRRILIATGSLDIYLPAMLTELTPDDLLATELQVADGRLTGHLATPNRVRQAKAEIVKAWLGQHQPAETWGYGNRPHDVPMLGLVDHPTIV